MPIKEKIEIKIDAEEATDNFGIEIFEQNIVLFIEEGYQHFLEGIKQAEKDHDEKKMKMLTHTLKTTARYMSSENFAQECHAIESQTKTPNWDIILQLLPSFYEDLEILHLEALKFYNEIKGIVATPPPKEEPDTNNSFQNKNIGNLKMAKTFTKTEILDKEKKSMLLTLNNEMIHSGYNSNSSNNLKNSSTIEIYSDTSIDKSENSIFKELEKLENSTNLNLLEVKGKKSDFKSIGISTPQFSSFALEISKMKGDVLNNNDAKPKKSFDDERIKKSKFDISHSNSSGVLSNSGSSKKPNSCIKSLRDIDKPSTSTGSYFKHKIEEKPKIAMMSNPEFKKIFEIDCQKIKISKIDSKEKFRNFSEDEIFKLMTRLRKIIEAENLEKKDLINFFKEFKIQLKLLNFVYICEKIENWIELIQDLTSLTKFKLNWADFDSLFLKINDDVNTLLETAFPENIIKNNIKKISSEKERNAYDPKTILSSDNLKGRNFAFNKNGESHCISNFKEYENTLKDLKPVAIDTLFKNGKTPQEISNGIKKIFEDYNENAKNNEQKLNVKLNRQNLQNSTVQDFSYPFKQDNFTCVFI